MYKVGDVAKLINVEKYEIFEKSITHKKLLEPNIIKKNGITYFNDRGLEILKTLFYGGINTSIPNKKEVLKEINKKDVLKEISKTEKAKSAEVNKVIDSAYSKDKKELYIKMDILTNEINSLDKVIDLKNSKIDELQKMLISKIEV